jgi:hypothetical protein
MPVDRAECRKKAEDCRRISDERERPLDKAQWLRIAEAWTILALTAPSDPRKAVGRNPVVKSLNDDT